MRAKVVPIKATGPDIQLESISPQTAEEWLGKNTRNRNVRKALVASIARDIKGGGWRLNGETIKFDTDGVLLDGQNRLHGIVKAGRTVQSFVVRDLPAETMLTIDTGVKRGFGDVLSIRGETNTHSVAAIARRGVMWDRESYSNTGQIIPSTSEMDAWAEANQTIYAGAALAQSQSGMRVLPGSIIGLCYVVFCRLDVFDAAFFLERVGHGAEYYISRGALGDELQRAQPAFALRRKVTNMRQSGGRINETTALAFTILAWNAYRAREHRSRFLIPAEGWGAKFPTPL